MSREDAATKARRYLAEGRLLVTAVSGDHVTAGCRGDGAVYRPGHNTATAGGVPGPSAPTAAPSWPRSTWSPYGEPYGQCCPR
jgi:hypothetical protein